MFKLYNLFNSNNENNGKKIIITDNDIKNKSIDEIKELEKNHNNRFIITNTCLHDTFYENNIDKMKFLKDKFQLSLPCFNGAFHIDVSVEEGNEMMAKFLVKEFNCQPSLYAKQMAHINGHHGLVFWMDNFSQQRNYIGIHNVHRRYDFKTKKMLWNNIIPLNYQY